MAKDAYYFSHDSNAKNDEKCMYIISKYGLEGYGIYWIFIEHMHEQSDGKLTCALIDGFSFRWGIDITLLKQFYNDAITIKLFVSDGEYFWSERVLRNKQTLEEKREKKSLAGKKGMQSRWGSDNTVITSDNTTITKDNKVKESKVNKNKVKENKSREMIETYTDNAVLVEAINAFVEMRKTIKKPMTERALKMMFNELNKLAKTDNEKISILNQSTMNCWQGLFELKRIQRPNYQKTNANSVNDFFAGRTGNDDRRFNTKTTGSSADTETIGLCVSELKDNW